MQRMREELVRRTYSETTIRSYLHAVEAFRRHVGKRLDHLGPGDLRRYQVYLLEDRKLANGTVVSASVLLYQGVEAPGHEGRSALSKAPQATAGRSQPGGSVATDRLCPQPFPSSDAPDDVRSRAQAQRTVPSE